MDHAKLKKFIEERFDTVLLPSLEAFIEIPNLSPNFDPQWATNGLMRRAVDHFVGYANGLEIEGLSLEVLAPEGRTPLVFATIEGAVDESVLLYGHLDKQPPAEGWAPGKGPTTPVVEDDRLYGRGSVDDGYGPWCSLLAIKALQELGLPHPRVALFVETGEESGSPDLGYYLDLLGERFGDVRLVVVPDSGCGDYEHLWFTSSLRGMVSGALTVSTTLDGLHSGSHGGIVPESFRVVRALLDRIEDTQSGRMLIDKVNVEIPKLRADQARETAKVLDEGFSERYRLPPGAQLMSEDVAELLLNATWRPSLAVIGADGLPPVSEAGNAIRSATTLKLSLRLPPGVPHEEAALELKRVLETDPPYGAAVRFVPGHGADGWHAPPFPEWLEKSADEASRSFFGKGALSIGEGGSIPLVNTLGSIFPKAEFVVTGLLGPGANAHGPNEMLHLGGARAITGCLAAMIHALAGQKRG